MDYVQLCSLLGPLVLNLKDVVSHTGLPDLCEKLGLPPPDSSGSKRERIASSFNALPDTALPTVARNLLAHHPPSATIRNQIQDILWSANSCPSIPKKYRREVARAVSIEDLYRDARRFDDLLERLWVLDAEDWFTLLMAETPGAYAVIFNGTCTAILATGRSKTFSINWVHMMRPTSVSPFFWKGWHRQMFMRMNQHSVASWPA